MTDDANLEVAPAQRTDLHFDPPALRQAREQTEVPGNVRGAVPLLVAFGRAAEVQFQQGGRNSRTVFYDGIG